MAIVGMHSTPGGGASNTNMAAVPTTTTAITTTTTTTTTALAFVPQNDSALRTIQTIRRQHDRQIDRWPPHINLLYPFAPSEQFEACSAVLSAALAEVPAFDLTFDRISYFKHGKSCTAWLSPDRSGADKLKALQAVLEACFPHCDDLARRASADAPSAFSPHLTVGQFRNESQVQAFIQNTSFRPVTVSVDRLSLLSRTQTSPFVSVADISLSHGDVSAVPKIPATPSSPGQKGCVDTSNSCFQILDGTLRLNFEIPVDSTAASGSRSSMLFVVDNSSSMHGSYHSVTKAVQYMLDETQKQAVVAAAAEPAFILYNSTAKLCSGAAVVNSRPAGCTSFENAFEAITDYINQQPLASNIAVVFMTDGEDTASKHLSENTQLFRSYLQSCRREVIVHSLGFGRRHKREFLQDLNTMGNIGSDGCYRYAEDAGAGTEASSGLAHSFSEIFDFLLTSVKIPVVVGNFTLEVDGTRVGGHAGGEDGRLKFDLLLRAVECEPKDDDGAGLFSGDTLTITVGGRVTTLQRAAVDPLFKVRVVEELELLTQDDLDKAQRRLNDIDPFRAPKRDRLQLFEMRAAVQGKLDKYHALFAKIARGLVAAGDKASVTAHLSSLKHETKFAKARRHRTMDKRAAANANSVMSIARTLEDLHHTLDMDAFSIYGPDESSLMCCLSGDTIEEMMVDSPSDIMVFGMQVHRPEHVIDAPTEVGVLGICAGTYSNIAFTATTKFACSAQGKGSTARALGGFDQATPRKPTIFDVHPDRADAAPPSSREPGEGFSDNVSVMGDGVGVFRGPDGQQMNAALPLYLNAQHWRRVEAQLTPTLGFFFTLDPLGFQEAQYMGLYMILGEMLARRARSLQSGDASFDSEWACWLIDDFTKLCAAVLPKVICHTANFQYYFDCNIIPSTSISCLELQHYICFLTPFLPLRRGSICTG
jgi:2'-5' RNA ligase